MEIKININELTRQQAFEIGYQLGKVSEHSATPTTVQAGQVITEMPKNKKQRKQRTANSPSNKWRFNTSVSRDTIAAIVQAKFEGASLQAIANDLNALGYKSVSGKPWSDQMVWSVAYSKQAKSAWRALEANNA